MEQLHAAVRFEDNMFLAAVCLLPYKYHVSRQPYINRELQLVKNEKQQVNNALIYTGISDHSRLNLLHGDGRKVKLQRCTFTWTTIICIGL